MTTKLFNNTKFREISFLSNDIYNLHWNDTINHYKFSKISNQL